MFVLYEEINLSYTEQANIDNVYHQGELSIHHPDIPRYPSPPLSLTIMILTDNILTDGGSGITDALVVLQ